jgi:UDP-2,3-diacylglucosamine hydrolase
MNEAVFISDLHLHPDQDAITERFIQFLDWATTNTQSVYILGDFFHVWVGDDLMTEFELNIAKRLKQLANLGIKLYFMPGNRDFLLGDGFLKLAKMQYLDDPSVVCLKGMRVFLTHGDAYCLHDKAHQLLRKISRPKLLKNTFLAFPKTIRAGIVNKIRNLSQNKKSLKMTNPLKYQLVKSKLFTDMKQLNLTTTIYGHIHLPGAHQSLWNNLLMQEYVLSDWDSEPQMICYKVSKGFYFKKIK